MLMKMVRYLTGETQKSFKPNPYTQPPYPTFFGDAAVTAKHFFPKIPRVVKDSRTAWVIQQLEGGRVLEVKDIKVENPRWNRPYTPLKAARRYLKAKGTPVKSLRVGKHGEKRYYLEK